MKAIFAIAALFTATSAFASYSASEGRIVAIQNNAVYHDLVIQGDAAKALYNDLSVEVVPNYNDNAPGYSKSGKDVVCDSTGGLNFSCIVRLDRATGSTLFTTSSEAASYSASEGTVAVIQNNEVEHDVVIHGAAAKAIYSDLNVQEYDNNNDVVPGKTKYGKNITCESISGVNFYCSLKLDRATGAAK